MSRWGRVAGGLFAASSTVLGCQVAVIDLGTNHPAERVDAGADAGAGGGMVEPVVTSDCPYVNEADVLALRGNPCTSTCADGEGTPRVVGSGAELVAVTSGQWRTCAGAVPWAADVVGVEFQAGCTVFLLHDVPDGGGVVRGVMPSDQGTFNVIQTTLGTSVTRRVEIYFPAQTWSVAVATSDCPHKMRLTDTLGGETELAGISTMEAPH